MRRSQTSHEKNSLRWLKVQQRMALNAQWLSRQGAIASRMAGSRRIWMVRFFADRDGSRRQCAIYLGDQPELIEKAREFLAVLRSQGRLAKELVLCAKLVGKVNKVFRDLCTRPGL
jgi:hypothetical protein